MPSPSETAYPRLKYSISADDLRRCYTPSDAEITLSSRSARGDLAQVGFLILFKTSQTLGRFIALNETPQSIIDHISAFMKISVSLDDLDAYDHSGSRRRHIRIIRNNRKLNPFDKKALSIAESAVKKAAVFKNEVVDLINIAIEALVKNTCELPAFNTLVDLAQNERLKANQAHCEIIFSRLTEEQKVTMDQILKMNEDSQISDWQQIKQDPGNPTPQHLKELLSHLKLINSIGLRDPLFEGLTQAKMDQFAADAKVLNISRMNRTQLRKKYALFACFFRVQKAQALDDMGEMIVRTMQKVRTRAKGSLEIYLTKHRKRTDRLISKLEKVALLLSEKGESDRLTAITDALEPSPRRILIECREHLAYSENNFFPFLWSHFKNQRLLLFQALESLNICSASQDKSLISAIEFICQNKLPEEDWLPTYRWNGNQVEYFVDLSWISEQWLAFVAGRKRKDKIVTNLDRRNFEVCVFIHVMWELKSGDLYIPGSQSFSDFRKQLIPWEEYKEKLPEFLLQAGLPKDCKSIVKEIKESLLSVSRETDKAFPACTAMRFVNGRPVLTKLNRKRQPQQLAVLEAMIESRMPPVSILDALADVHRWLDLSKFFKPISGQDARIKNVEERHIKALFCYGCNLGPAQTVRSLKNSNRKEIAWIHQTHFNEEKIYQAIAGIVNEYNRFELPKYWGSGKTASADGTKWDLYEQNLLSEYHIRYGGYGGIGYYHTSDTYVALFSHFIPCGVRETTYILDGLLKNESDIQPDTIYGDSHAQSAAAFGLSYLLGIKLMPRIKNWKKLTLYKGLRKERYQHIEPLFSGEEIDWELIETHLPDMLRVAMSIKIGKITASTILKRLGSISRKNKLYFAFRELGRAMRTQFLLKYISDPEMRSMIEAGINKSEGFNRFTKWVAFGGDGVIAENDRDQQRKVIAYNHLVSNCILFHTINGMTNAIRDLMQEGFPIDKELISCLSPFITKHINRFGDYTLDLKRQAALAKYSLKVH